jgi:hypothetical protein
MLLEARFFGALQENSAPSPTVDENRITPTGIVFHAIV